MIFGDVCPFFRSGGENCLQSLIDLTGMNSAGDVVQPGGFTAAVTVKFPLFSDTSCYFHLFLHLIDRFDNGALPAVTHLASAPEQSSVLRREIFPETAKKTLLSIKKRDCQHKKRAFCK
jgi:hypothetical protein